MSNSAYLRDINSLKELRVVIDRFCEECESQLLAIDSKLQAKIDHLKSLENKLKYKIDSAREDLNDAFRALTSCENETYKSKSGVDCDYENKEVYRHKKQLELAENNYYVFKKEIRNLEIAINTYQNIKNNFKTVIQFEKETATSCLKQLINGAEDYLSVTSLISNSHSNNISKVETDFAIIQTIISPQSDMVDDLVFIKVFSFRGQEGISLSVLNIGNKGVVTTIYSHNDIEYICSELKIEVSGSNKFGKILNVNIPPVLKNEKIGKYLIQNLEAISRANDCVEIYGWAGKENILFYKDLGYNTRHEFKEIGGEIYKSLRNN